MEKRIKAKSIVDVYKPDEFIVECGRSHTDYEINWHMAHLKKLKKKKKEEEANERAELNFNDQLAKARALDEVKKKHENSETQISTDQTTK